jgi:primary-amine oxidase
LNDPANEETITMKAAIVPGARIWFLPTLLLCLAAGSSLQEPAAADRQPVEATPAHPLDPLSAAEIKRAVEVLRKEKTLSEQVRFPTLVLHEPAKETMLAYQSGQTVPRQAFAVVYDYKANTTHEAVIDLTQGKVVAFERIEGVQPMMMFEEYEKLPEVVRADSRVQEALKKRGITAFKEVLVDLWAAGDGPLPELPANTRLSRCVFFHTAASRIGRLRPIEGLHVLVDLNARKVVQVIDRGPVAITQRSYDFTDPSEVGPLRPALKPLLTSQPQGASFEVRGQEVRWDRWRFRWTNHQREGLVVHQVGFEDQGKLRSILYRGSIAEMLVPYGDPDQGWNWRAAFDEGEYGLGHQSMSLDRGLDVPATTRLFASTFATYHGQAHVVPDCVALYERDGGLLWKHRDPSSGRNEVRRGRELVLASVATLGNYDYGVHWVFTQDGQIKVEIELTGLMLPKGVPSSSCERCAGLTREPGKPADSRGDGQFGTLVAPNLVAPNHQHFFCFRLDLDVDGTNNSVSEINVRPDPAAHNAFVAEETVLADERQACRSLNPECYRRWKVFNPGRKTSLGHFPGYALEPEGNSVGYLAAHSPTRRRASFINHHLWVTRYKPGEQYAAGPYPNRAKGGAGLPRYVQDNERIVNEDVVLWYTVGTTHIARPEEWPVMPAARTGFRLAPDCFFTRNPALDLPPGPK